MRKIKFRAWDKEKKKMLQPDHDAFDFITINDLSKLNLEFLQFTGLLDKNEKEIFEGDLVKVDFNVFTIKYFTRLTWDGGCPHPGFYFEQNGSEMSYHDNFEDLEVIGNIYENPELLKK